MTALAERLVSVRSSALRGGMGRGEERQPVQHRLALCGGGTGKDQCTEVVRRQGERAYGSELRAWDTLHGPQRWLGFLCPTQARKQRSRVHENAKRGTDCQGAREPSYVHGFPRLWLRASCASLLPLPYRLKNPSPPPRTVALSTAGSGTVRSRAARPVRSIGKAPKRNHSCRPRHYRSVVGPDRNAAGSLSGPRRAVKAPHRLKISVTEDGRVDQKSRLPSRGASRQSLILVTRVIMIPESECPSSSRRS